MSYRTADGSLFSIQWLVSNPTNSPISKPQKILVAVWQVNRTLTSHHVRLSKGFDSRCPYYQWRHLHRIRFLKFWWESSDIQCSGRYIKWSLNTKLVYPSWSSIIWSDMTKFTVCFTLSMCQSCKHDGTAEVSLVMYIPFVFISVFRFWTMAEFLISLSDACMKMVTCTVCKPTTGGMRLARAQLSNYAIKSGKTDH